MPRNALTIVKEYLDQEQPQVRRNALTALAVLGSEESLVELAGHALKNFSDSEFVARAEDEIESLPAEQRSSVVKHLTSALAGDACKPAYVILGRLRNRGVPVDLSSLPFWERINRAREFGFRYKARGVGRFWKQRLAAAWGSAFALCILLVFLGSLFEFGTDGERYALIGIAFLTVLPVLASGLSSPISLQASPGAAVAWDCAMLGVMGGVAGALIALTAVTNEVAADRAVISSVVSMVLAIMSARLGAAGALGLVRGRVSNFLLQTLTGWAIGALVLTGLLLALGIHNVGFSGGLWYFTQPVLISVAAIFAMIDSKVAPKAVTTHGLQRFCFSCLILFVLLGLAATLGGRERLDPVTIASDGLYPIGIPSIPYVREIRLTTKMELSASLSDSCEEAIILSLHTRQTDGDVPKETLSARKGSASEPVLFQPEPIDLEVQPEYFKSRSSASGLLPEFVRRVSTLGGAQPAQPTCTAEIKAAPTG